MKFKRSKELNFERKHWLEPFIDSITELGPTTENKIH